jgi:hypothetical protein
MLLRGDAALKVNEWGCGAYGVRSRIRVQGKRFDAFGDSLSLLLGGQFSDVPTLQTPPSKRPRMGHPPRFFDVVTCVITEPLIVFLIGRLAVL